MKYQKAHFSVSLVFLLLFCAMSLSQNDATLIINIYDTYLVFDYTTFFIIFAQWFGLIGLGYWILARFNIKMISSLQLAHFIGSLILLIPLCFPKYFRIEDKDFPYLGASDKIYYQYDESAIFLLAFLLFIAVQLVYFLNILISTLRRKKY